MSQILGILNHFDNILVLNFEYFITLFIFTKFCSSTFTRKFKQIFNSWAAFVLHSFFTITKIKFDLRLSVLIFEG